MTLILKFRFCAGLLALCLVSFADNMSYRNAEGGKIKFLVPVDFQYYSKAQYVPQYKGDGTPDDYFFSKGRSEEIAVIQLSASAGNLTDLRPMMTGVAQMGTKTYFNDTTTVNGIKMYVLEVDGKDGEILKHIKYFALNADGATYLCSLACLINLTGQWKPTAEKIIRSVKIN
jgi:hypothetical protein